jgi:hypothetical protein
MEFGKKAYLLRAVKAARKTLDITSCVQSGFLFKRKIDEKTGLEASNESAHDQKNQIVYKISKSKSVQFLIFYDGYSEEIRGAKGRSRAAQKKDFSGG